VSGLVWFRALYYRSWLGAFALYNVQRHLAASEFAAGGRLELESRSQVYDMNLGLPKMSKRNTQIFLENRRFDPTIPSFLGVWSGLVYYRGRVTPPARA
jgi:hypothetical protein